MTDNLKKGSDSCPAERSEPPPDWAYDWGRVPYNPMEDARAFNMTTSGPSPMTPRGETAASAPPANTTGWQAERGLGPQPGIDLIDRMVIAADRRERQQAQRPDSERMMEIMVKMMEMQSQTLEAVAAAILRDDKGKPKPKPKSKPGAKAK
jgi:hypothetical protein